MRNFLLFACFLLSLAVSSQTADDYLSKAITKLNEGNCESAQKFYNVYKDLSGKSNPSVQVLIDDCVNEKNRTYLVGDVIKYNGATYTVAYIRDGGKHGLAVRDAGWGYVNLREDVEKRGIPTIDELKLIYSNRDMIRLYDIYWSCTWDKKTKANRNSSTFLFTMDFSTGQVKGEGDRCCQRRVILKIYRF